MNGTGIETTSHGVNIAQCRTSRKPLREQNYNWETTCNREFKDWALRFASSPDASRGQCHLTSETPVGGHFRALSLDRSNAPSLLHLPAESLQFDFPKAGQHVLNFPGGLQLVSNDGMVEQENSRLDESHSRRATKRQKISNGKVKREVAEEAKFNAMLGRKVEALGKRKYADTDQEAATQRLVHKRTEAGSLASVPESDALTPCASAARFSPDDWPCPTPSCIFDLDTPSMRCMSLATRDIGQPLFPSAEPHTCKAKEQMDFLPSFKDLLRVETRHQASIESRSGRAIKLSGRCRFSGGSLQSVYEAYGNSACPTLCAVLLYASRGSRLQLQQVLPPAYERASSQLLAQDCQQRLQQRTKPMSKRLTKPVYRRPLQELYDSNNKELPTIFKDSVEVLKQRGLGLPGLFLGRADPRKVSLLERAWNQGLNPLRVAQVQDCYAVAESLLSWLRLLPAPVIPCKLYRLFLRVQHCSTRTEALLHLHHLLCQMEGCACILLMKLLQLLSEYQSAQRARGHFAAKLGQVFGGILLQAQEGPLPLASPENLKTAASLTDFLIDNQASIFTQPATVSKAAHRPPSRAKRNQSLKGELAAAAAKLAAAEAPHCNQADRFAARAPLAQGATWPAKHLRVVVVPPFDDTEICYMDSEDGSATASPQHNTHFAEAYRSSQLENPPRELTKLAPVPEGCPLAGTDAECQGLSVDSVVGALLSSSMDSMLFSDDDDAFLARSCSLLSCPSASASSFCCEESTEMSSADEEVPESPLSSPNRATSRRAPPIADSTGLHNWLPAGR